MCDFGSATTRVWRPNSSSSERRQAEDDINNYTTMSYRSPEMADLYQGYEINEKSDIWALGVLLYRLAYFEPPWEADSNLAILNCKYKIPHKNYSEDLPALIKSLLIMDPSKRPDVYFVLEKVMKVRDKQMPSAMLDRRDKYRRKFQSSSSNRARNDNNSNSNNSGGSLFNQQPDLFSPQQQNLFAGQQQQHNNAQQNLFANQNNQQQNLFANQQQNLFANQNNQQQNLFANQYGSQNNSNQSSPFNSQQSNQYGSNNRQQQQQPQQQRRTQPVQQKDQVSVDSGIVSASLFAALDWQDSDGGSPSVQHNSNPSTAPNFSPSFSPSPQPQPHHQRQLSGTSSFSPSVQRGSSNNSASPSMQGAFSSSDVDQFFAQPHFNSSPSNPHSNPRQSPPSNPHSNSNSNPWQSPPSFDQVKQSSHMFPSTQQSPFGSNDRSFTPSPPPGQSRPQHQPAYPQMHTMPTSNEGNATAPFMQPILRQSPQQYQQQQPPQQQQSKKGARIEDFVEFN